MTIVRFGARFDRFAKADPRLNEIEVNIEASAKPFRHDVQMQFALRSNDRLVKFGIRHELKGGIFAVQSGKSRGNFVFLPSGPGLERRVERGFGKMRGRKLHRPVGLA